jgi:hypothetical protein
MRHRGWLLVVAGVLVTHAFILVRFAGPWYPVYGETDIWASSFLAAVLVVAWVSLEISDRVASSRDVKCRCGYSLRGVKCPECGKAIGGADEPG